MRRGSEMATDDHGHASKLRIDDVVRVGASGPRARKTRTALSALGISIGIAALVGCSDDDSGGAGGSGGQD